MEGSKNKQCMASWCCKYHLFGVTFIAFGISLVLFLPDFVNNLIMQNLELRTDSRSYADWKKPSVPLFFDIFIFNWTNPRDIKNSSSKPILQQLGPYRFREQPDKHNITFGEDNLTITYRKSSLYNFDVDGSIGSLDDVVNTVNMIALGAAIVAENLVPLQFFFANLALNGQEIHVTKKVREILFEGYHDGLLSFGNNYGSKKTPFETMGFFVKRNATDELSGNYTVHTGIGDIFKLGQVQKFNNKTEFPFYEGECKKVKGSAGEFFPPQHSINESLFLFTPDMCRSLAYDYEKDIVHNEIRGNRYTAGLRNIDNGTLYAENKCYPSGMPSGVMNISICNYDQPMFISYPHFYLADPSYVEAVEGLMPNKENHESYMTLQSKLGITLEVTARFQTNVLLRSCGPVSKYKNVPQIMMPLFHVEQKFIMDESKTSELRVGLFMLNSSMYFGFILVFLGLFIIAFKRFRYYCCRGCKCKIQEEYSLQKEVRELHPLYISDKC